ncbi:MAG: hypothetical protein A2Y21_03120 [Clostridiales bacterium GWC2_40_7]|nr:MAG: hypothetical protein A2Y21_03120 [Clostridiales bacterium GWC2_40_7]
MNSMITDTIEGLKLRKNDFDNAVELQTKLWNGEKTEKQPLLLHCELDEEDNNKLPAFNTKEIHFDSGKMFLNGLREVMMAVYGGAEAVPSMRANMGCGIFPTLFGIEQDLFEDKMPWVKNHLSKEALSVMEPEDLKISDEFKAGMEHMAYMAEKLEGTGCRIFPMDVQGAFDTAHIVYGDAIFYDIYDDPGFVHHLLELSCEAIFMGMEECFKVMPDSKETITHYNSLIMPRSKGGIKISEDTSTLLSKDQIEEFVSPYINRILSRYGGGYLHYCGKNSHLFERVMENPLAFGFNLGNPEKHDMEYVLKRCAEAGKIYYAQIPKNENETNEQYFGRYITASKAGDRKLILLQYTCRKEERDEVLQAWEAANEETKARNKG